MARRCDITGKTVQVGNQRSFSNRATRRRFVPNLITKKVLDERTGRYKKMKIAVSTLRTLLKSKRGTVEKAKELLSA